MANHNDYEGFAFAYETNAAGLVVFRWVVEQTLAWLHRFRRLALLYERRADDHEAFLTLGCASSPGAT